MQIQYLFEIIGTIVFAISGALAADENSGKDWFGITFIGFITAIGGGSLRDMLLGSYPLAWINDVNFIYAIVFGIILTKILYKPLEQYRRTLFLFDTMGIALFTILGTEKSLELGVHPVIAAIMGMFSAVMGGVIRDTLTNSTPVIFRKEVYATACLVGAIIFLILYGFDVNRTVNFLISGSLIIAIRILAVYFKWSIPKFK
ncbi:MAG: trimeric intracellular cation channel family protein [Moheibacter sp.]